jgi:hypothetical protein
MTDEERATAMREATRDALAMDWAKFHPSVACRLMAPMGLALLVGLAAPRACVDGHRGRFHGWFGVVSGARRVAQSSYGRGSPGHLSVELGRDARRPVVARHHRGNRGVGCNVRRAFATRARRFLGGFAVRRLARRLSPRSPAAPSSTEATVCSWRCSRGR